MPSAESNAELRQELATERERLGAAVRELRAEVDDLRRKLPYVAAGVVATAIAVGIVRRQLRRLF